MLPVLRVWVRRLARLDAVGDDRLEALVVPSLFRRHMCDQRLFGRILRIRHLVSFRRLDDWLFSGAVDEFCLADLVR